MNISDRKIKKYRKQILIFLVSIITLFLQYQFINKPKETSDDKNRLSAILVRVVDGDTLVLNIDNVNEKIRLIGMDTPESVKPNHPVECFGKEATLHAKSLLKNKELTFVSDYTQDTRDRYGRMLGYVFMDGKNFAEIMIADGYAYEYTYNKKYRYQSNFKSAQRNARKEERGLWSPETCNGKSSQ